MGQKSADIDNSEKKLEISEKKKLNLIKDNFDKKSKISVKNQMQLKNFLEFLKFEKRSSQNTLNGYNRDLMQFFLFVKKDFSEIGEKEISSYIDNLNKKLRKNSILRKVSVLKAFYKFCYLNKSIEKDPAGMVKNLNREYQPPEILTLEEIMQIVDNCPATPAGMQNRLIIKLLIITGAMISEILNLEIKDVESPNYEFIKIFRKNSKYQIMPADNNFEKEIKNYLKVYRPELKNANENLKIFPNIRREKFWKNLKIIAQNAKIEKNVYPHIFRNSLAEILSEANANIQIIQEILGKVNITTAKIEKKVKKFKLKMIYNNIKLGDD
ncbi:tyrosine-type recombinase/integrase [Leptotrichia sp. HSP-536]|uniref:Tyrosine-type recombinase/integrase n=1 Tax=Leptotrichia alba TaxID=3239304 RepID=A0AB39V6M9_9FUSO